jgi:hypothetical protein
MTRTLTQRGLSPSFLKDLTGGMLSSLLERMQQDLSLETGIRSDYLNIYYRGGNLLRVKARPDGRYTFFFDENYRTTDNQTKHPLPKDTVESVDDVKAWVTMIPVLKDMMDLWFGKHPKDERALQQLVAWENNSSPWANGTDYFIIDIEYDNHKGARFDLVALRWESTPLARKLANGYLPRLTIIEMKAGDGTLQNRAGIRGHLDQMQHFLQNEEHVNEFKVEMLEVLRQKRELNLIRALEENPHRVHSIETPIDLMFLLAGHNPASTRLEGVLSEIKGTCSPQHADGLLFCAANFMGFGLYHQNVLSLPDFQERYQRMIHDPS